MGNGGIPAIQEALVSKIILQMNISAHQKTTGGGGTEDKTKTYEPD
jgi:hypothetical protein